MSDPDLVLYHFPGACSQVTVCALEMAGLPYRLELVDLSKDAQSSEAYLAVSPLGKVPTLLVDGQVMIENLALLTFIAALRPDCGIFPADASPQARAETVGGMAFCSGTLHPQIRGIANPQRITTGDGEPVREKSRYLAAKSFAYAEKRLAARGGWWLGQPTIVDVYLNWAASVARRVGLDMGAYPQVETLPSRLMEIPGFAAMQEEEQRSRAALGI